jgi:hypothetical protein
MVTRLAAVAAVTPIAAPSAVHLAIGFAARAVLPHRDNIGGLGALYQVSELFEITLVSDGGRPAASSMTTTRLASVYES